MTEFPKHLGKALFAVQGEITGVVRDSTNPQFRGKMYASLESVIETVRPAFQKHGLAFMQSPGEYTDGAMHLTTTIIHAESGECISSTISSPLAKVDPQGVGSCLTYLCRYSLMAICGLPPVDDDAQAASNGNTPATRPAIAALPKKDAKEAYTKMQVEIRESNSREQLTEWMNGNKPRIALLPEDWQGILRSLCSEQMMDLKNRERAA